MSETGELVNKFKPVKYKDDAIRGRLRESLAEGIYQDVDSSFHVLRELVQNGVDSIDDFRDQEDSHFEGEIRIRLAGDSISVFDTGLGMTLEELREVPTFAASRKDPSTRVGFRGIGFWANSALASTITVISKKYGEQHKYALKVNVADWKKEEDRLSLLQLLNKYVEEDEPSIEDVEEHYTLVVLEGLTEVGKYLVEHKSEAEKYLRKTLPLEFAKSKEFTRREQIRNLIYRNVPDHKVYKVFLNDLENEKELFKAGYAALQDIISDEIRKPATGKGRKKEEVIGWYWAALHSEPEKIKDHLVKGIRFRVKGFAIGDENLLRNLLSTDKETPDWYYGEIYVLDSAIKPDSSRTNFEGNQAWHDFVSALTTQNGLVSKLKKGRRKFSNTERARVRIPELIQEANAILSNPVAASASDAETVKKELEKRLRDTPNPEDRIDAQETVKRLNKGLSSGKIKAPTKPGQPKQGTLLMRFYSEVIQILDRSISDESLRKRVRGRIAKAYESIRSGS